MPLPSPLFIEPPPYVICNFEATLDGRWRSPQVPAKEMEPQAESNGVTKQALSNRATRLKELAAAVDVQKLAAELPSASLPSLADVGYNSRALASAESVERVNELNRGLNYFEGNSVNLPPDPNENESRGNNNQQAEPPPVVKGKGTLAQQTARNADYETRVRRIQSVAQQGMYEQQQFSSNNGFQQMMVPPEQAKVEVGVSRPMWVGDRLLLARRVEEDKRTVIQGCWLDWPKLKTRLLAETTDLIRGADLVPVLDSADVDPGRMLAGLPVRLVMNVASAADPALSPTLRWALWIGWGALGLAAFAAAALLAGVMTLSERRAAFVSSVTHELRTPLTTFRMYSEMLARGMVPDAGRRQEYLHTLQREAERLTHLVENVLSYARLERGRRPSATDRITAASLLERIGPRLAARAQHAGMQCEISLADDAGDLPLTTDANVVEQILFNLVDNAAKYARSAADGRIHVAAERCGGVVGIQGSRPRPRDAARAALRPHSPVCQKRGGIGRNGPRRRAGPGPLHAPGPPTRRPARDCTGERRRRHGVPLVAARVEAVSKPSRRGGQSHFAPAASAKSGQSPTVLKLLLVVSLGEMPARGASELYIPLPRRSAAFCSIAVYFITGRRCPPRPVNCAPRISPSGRTASSSSRHPTPSFDENRRTPRKVSGLLRVQRLRPPPQRRAGAPLGPLGAVHAGRHEPVQGPLPRQGASSSSRGPPPARNACAPATSTTWAARRITTRSSRCWATSASATISSAKRSTGPGSFLPTRNGSASNRSGSPSPSTLTTTRRPTSGPDDIKLPPERIERLGRRRKLLAGQRPQPGARRRLRTVQRNLLITPTGQSRRNLEPRLHAVQPRRRSARQPPAAAQQEHRHRHGPGAHGRGAARRRDQLPHRHPAADRRGRGRSLRREVRSDSENGRRLRRIADHVRACTFAIHENVYPGPNKEKYVIKRLLRRAVLDGHQMGVREPFLHKLVPAVADMMKRPYPELSETVDARRRRDREGGSNFFCTIDAGLESDRAYLRRDEAATIASRSSGAEAAELYTTHGFPPELFETLAAEHNLAFDWEGFRPGDGGARRALGQSAAHGDAVRTGRSMRSSGRCTRPSSSATKRPQRKRR